MINSRIAYSGIPYNSSQFTMVYTSEKGNNQATAQHLCVRLNSEDKVEGFVTQFFERGVRKLLSWRTVSSGSGPLKLIMLL